jgi:hypothetical protein
MAKAHKLCDSECRTTSSEHLIFYWINLAQVIDQLTAF